MVNLSSAARTLSTTSAAACAFTPLQQARQLTMPTREDMLRRDPSTYRFWDTNAKTLEKAWEEWAETDPEARTLPSLMVDGENDDESVYDPKLRRAIAAAWKDPVNNEDALKDLWEEVAPGVYQCQFFDPNKLHKVRDYLDKAANAGIPTRPPHGIVLNRRGFMIDPRSVGYLAIPGFQAFYRDLIDTYMRPMGRLIFPDEINADNDSESFAFSIQYQPNKDQSIQQHTDASTLTLNINLNLPTDDQWTGSSLYFVDRRTGEKKLVEFAPGVAVMHSGSVPHAALPITSGERSNLVLWLFGKNRRAGYSYFPEYEDAAREPMTPQERWTRPAALTDIDYEDRWSPF